MSDEERERGKKREKKRTESDGEENSQEFMRVIVVISGSKQMSRIN